MSQTQEFTTGRGGLFRIPSVPTESDELNPDEFLDFFNRAFSLNGKAVNDIERGSQDRRTERIVIPPSSEKPIAVVMDYKYSFLTTRSPQQEEVFTISRTSKDVLGFVSVLSFLRRPGGLFVGEDDYAVSEGSAWTVTNYAAGEQNAELKSEHRQHLGELVLDFVELVT